MKLTHAIPIIISLFICTLALAQSPPPMPSDYANMYNHAGTVTSIIIGDSTATPETLDTQADVTIFSFPWDNHNDIDFPAFASSPDDLLDCLDDVADESITFFDVITDRFVDESQDWTTYTDMTDSLTTVLDAVDALFDNEDVFHDYLCQLGPYYTYDQWYLYYSSWPGPSCTCGSGLHSPPSAPSSMPSYQDAEDYYDAVAELEEKLEAVWYNFWLEVQDFDTGDDYYLVDLVDNLHDRIELVKDDFAYDVANAWYSP